MNPLRDGKSEVRPRHYGVEYELAAYRRTYVEGDGNIEDFERLTELALRRLRHFEDERTNS